MESACPVCHKSRLQALDESTLFCPVCQAYHVLRPDGTFERSITSKSLSTKRAHVLKIERGEVTHRR